MKLKVGQSVREELTLPDYAPHTCGATMFDLTTRKGQFAVERIRYCPNCGEVKRQRTDG